MDNIFLDKRLNYKDFLIIIFTWFFLFMIVYHLNSSELAEIIVINDFLAFMLKTISYIIFSAIFYSYFNLIYDFSLKDLGFDFKKINFKFSFLTAISVILFLTALLVNFAADWSNISRDFNPVYYAKSLKIIMSGLPLIMVILFSAVIISTAEMFLVNKIIFSLFKLKFPKIIASILTALFFPIMLLEFRPEKILILFLSVLIANYIYNISEKNLIPSIIYYTSFLTIYITFIYGYNFLI